MSVPGLDVRADPGLVDALPRRRPAKSRCARRSLAAAAGNISRAARRLGLKSRFALCRLMKKHRLAVLRDDDAAGGV